ncbi:MAG: lamin tail domain-containing protein [Bacteroidales bacterium]|nr:lamin tail domain-containing protein [Bacteroidales bacterium]
MKRIIFVLTAAAVLAAGAVLAVCCKPSQTLPCDIYRQGGTPCVTAHSTTRLLNSRYRGPLYQVQRDSDGATLDIRATRDGIANTAPQDDFCEGTVCYISIIYDQSGLGNDLLPAPPGTFQGPDTGGFNNPAIADMAPALLRGHKVYGVYIMPGMGYRCNDARGLAIDDEPEGIYYVIDGTHYDSGCCFDYGNSSTNGRAVGTGTMETTYYGTSTAWGRGNGEGPWIMADMEAGLFSGYDAKQNDVPSITEWRFVSVYVNGGGGNQWDLRGADASCDTLTTFYNGPRPHTPDSDAYYPMHKKGGMLLGNGGDNGNGSAGTFYEGVMTVGYPSDKTLAAVQANIAAAQYRAYPLALSRITSFRPGESRQVGVFLENVTSEPFTDISFDFWLPAGWGIRRVSEFTHSLSPGEKATVIYEVTASSVRSSEEMKTIAYWTGGEATVSARVRCAEAVKINEIGLSGEGVNPFIELYNAGEAETDLSGLELVVRRSGQSAVRALTLPQGTSLAPGAFLLLKQAPEAVPAPTTIFIPVSTGPKLSFPAGTEVLPATSLANIEVGRKLGIGLGGDYELVTVTEVGTPATQSNLSEPAKAGDNTLHIDTTADLTPGQELTVDTGDRKEIVIVKEVLVSARKRIRQFGEPFSSTPSEPGLVELTQALRKDHAEGVDVSSPGTGIRFEPATRFVHRSGEALQPFTSEPEGVYATGQPDKGLVFRYAMSASAGSVALVDPATGTVLDAIVYGSQQSNSSANGTITSPELATLEGDQRGGGCQAVAPQPMPAWLLARNPNAKPQTVCLVRWPDGADTDNLCEDFRLASVPTPGKPNRAE